MNVSLLLSATLLKLVVVFTTAGQVTAAAGAGAGNIDFTRDIRPLLSDRCFTCHGPDETTRHAELRLDVREGASASAIEPGNASQSELVRRITSTDPAEQMPPPDSGRRALTAEEVSVVRRWIDQGATYEQHWSFRTLSKAAPPTLGDVAKHPIDRFLLSKLEAKEIEPAGKADRRTLLRRLSFDLTGLPPTLEDVEQFVQDTSPNAYERVVEDMLDSPHFGERMAMYWLDVVRYADTNGIHGDNFRPHSSYRDWVIKAFNDNLPYDQFVVQQLAGDLLPKAGFAEQIASGFNRLNMTTREGGAQPKEYEAIYLADRVRNSSAIFLGITMGCAQCHDHKFDPISTKDFYAWGAFFADLEETAVGVQQPVTLRPIRHRAEQTLLDDRIEALQKIVATPTPELEAAQIEWEERLEKSPGVWSGLELVSHASKAGAKLITNGNGTIQLAEGETPERDTYTLEFTSELPSVTAIYLEVMPDVLSPEGGPGRGSNGNFALTDLEVFVNGKRVQLTGSSATFSQTGYQIEAAIDDNQGTGWAILPKVNQSHHAVFELAPYDKRADERTDATSIRIVMKQNLGAAHLIGRFRWWATDAQHPVEVKASLELQSVARTLKLPREERSDQQSRELANYYRQITPLLAETHAELEKLLAEQEKIGGPRPVLVSRQRSEPRTVRILPRGNWMDDSGPTVQPAIPTIFGRLSVTDRRANRLDLAHWIASPENPLTARVQMNRLWKIVFGRGLALPLDDFGAQGRVPLHPEMLDWLATEFVASGWDTKALLRLLVTSEAYRRSSVPPSNARELDPENEYYACQNRYRLEAEMVRDNALAVSGLLDATLGGTSKKPYQPAGYWSHLNFPLRTYQHDVGADQNRRGLYTYWCRTFLHPSMSAFDAPAREECTVDRPRSNTPLAALVLLNDPTYVEAARALAGRIVEEQGSTADQIQRAYEIVLQRLPTVEEQQLLAKLYEEQMEFYESRPELAESIQTVGLAARKQDRLAERAAWISVARTLLNLHETITRN